MSSPGEFHFSKIPWKGILIIIIPNKSLQSILCKIDMSSPGYLNSTISLVSLTGNSLPTDKVHWTHYISNKSLGSLFPREFLYSPNKFSFIQEHLNMMSSAKSNWIWSFLPQESYLQRRTPRLNFYEYIYLQRRAFEYDVIEFCLH